MEESQLWPKLKQISQVYFLKFRNFFKKLFNFLKLFHKYISFYKYIRIIKTVLEVEKSHLEDIFGLMI